MGYWLKGIKWNNNPTVTGETSGTIYPQALFSAVGKYTSNEFVDDYIFIIEEFCSEGSLKDKLDKIIIFPEFIVKIIMFQMFKALLYLGSKNIVHGNLKLENILLELNDIEKEKKVVYKFCINSAETLYSNSAYGISKDDSHYYSIATIYFCAFQLISLS